MINGFINILKPSGMTSHDVIAYLRKLLKNKRIGHGGTLDPKVAGVLPIAIGKATRLLEFLLEADKEYRCEMVLGVETTTQDLDGDIIHRKTVTAEQIKNLPSVINRFTGEIEQFPPMTSAVHHQGKRLYKLAREGIEIERPSRLVKVHRLEILDIIPDKTIYSIRFHVVCSKGTYIRTLCHDIGETLGCGGSMAFLLRTRVEGFSLENSYTLEEVEKLWQNGNQDFLMPMTGVLSLPTVLIDDNSARDLKMGKKIAINKNQIEVDIYNGQKFQIVDVDGLLAIGELLIENKDYKIQPKKVLR